MATIEEMQAKMTIYYSKNTGVIKSYCGGINDMSFFAEDKDDFSVIWDFIVIDRDEFVLKNIEMYVINPELKRIEVKSEYVPQYPIASQ